LGPVFNVVGSIEVLSRLKPGGDEDLADVFFGVFAHTVERAGAGPKVRPRQVVGVPLDPGVEEVDGGGFGPQELFGVVEVGPGLPDRALRVVALLLGVLAWKPAGLSRRAFCGWKATPITARDRERSHLVEAARDIRHDNP
jgi:hypothetical protein